MAFKALFLAHAPDGDPREHRCVIETPQYYKLFVAVVKDQEQAIQVCKEAVEKEGVRSILLCPGFAHGDIAELSKAVGEDVGISVARGDGPSNRISMEVMTSEGWFSGRRRE